MSNCCLFMKDKEVLRETKGDPFSHEDADNVRIPCALSSVAYEIYNNLIAILKHPQAL